MSGRLIWAHAETEGLRSKAQEAFSAALAQRWPDSDEESNRLIRAWLLSIVNSIASLGDGGVQATSEGDELAKGMGLSPGEMFKIEVSPSNRKDNYDWQAAMATALGAIASRGHVTVKDLILPDSTVLRIRTTDGDGPTIISGAPASYDVAAIGIVAGVVIVACSGILAGAVGWIVSQFNERVAIEAAQQGKTTTAMAAMTSAAQIIDQHQEREKQAGASIPYSQPELEVLETLRAAITSTAGWQPPALQSVPDLRGAASSFAGGLGIGTIIAVAVVAWLLTQRK